jgi:hypothetical protein
VLSAQLSVSVRIPLAACTGDPESIQVHADAPLLSIDDLTGRSASLWRLNTRSIGPGACDVILVVSLHVMKRRKRTERYIAAVCYQQAGEVVGCLLSLFDGRMA